MYPREKISGALPDWGAGPTSAGALFSISLPIAAA